MVPELGHFAIILALFFAMLQIYHPARGMVVGQFLFLSFSMLCLIFCFVTNDLTVLFVRDHSLASLPLIYRMGAAWGGHEGSLLLWCLILSGWTFIFSFFADNNLSQRSFQIILRVLGVISAGFIIFLFFTSNPFLRDFANVPAAGEDLTPILQDPGLIFHPPMLYLGYVGFAVSFAFAMCALIEGKFEAAFAKACRPWVMLPWAFLSCGIVLGSWWAYRELGWGGWWFWDPVENASLLPWLSATGLIHTLIVSEKRDVFKGWTILLAILTFALCLLGTFLVRSGVIVSVHAFANDPSRGVFLLGYMALIIGAALSYYVYRIQHFYQAPQFKLFSRETLLLVNSVVLISAVATIVIGTLYPIVLDALGLEKISVGEPYFNAVFVPIMLPALLLMGIAPHVNWHRQAFDKLWKKNRNIIFMSVVIGFFLPVLFGFKFYWLTATGVTLGVWIILGTLFSANKNLAMVLAHVGIGILVLGIVLNKSYSAERQVKISIGETVELAGYQFTFENINEIAGPNYDSLSADFLVKNQRGFEKVITSEQRIYRAHEQMMNKSGISANVWRDLYVALGSPLSDKAWSVRVYYKPFVRWIWFGGVLLLLAAIPLSSSAFRWRRGLGRGGLLRQSPPLPNPLLHKKRGGEGVFILFLIFIVVILYRGLFLHPAQIPSPLVNKAAPALSDEKFLGNITLVNVFASWCSACQEEHAFFQELAKKKYLTLYGLDYKDAPSAAKKYLEKNGNPYQVVISDEKGDIAINWGVYGTPETFLIDKKGIVRYKQIGPLTQEVWEKTLQPLIEKIRIET